MDGNILLANCAGSREYDQANDERLKNDLLQVLLSTAAPKCRTAGVTGPAATAHGLATEPTISELEFGAKFLSLTITSGEPISVLLEHRLLDRLGESLLGAKSEDDALIPITLDLRELPLEATGIVCGVAGRLAQGSSGTDLGKSLTLTPLNISAEPIEISFLSTARAGTVIVRANQLERALQALDEGVKRVENGNGNHE